MDYNLPENFKPKSFWEKPEGKTGVVVLGTMMGAGGIGAYIFLPMLVAILQNTLYAGILLIALGSMAYVATDVRFRTLIAYAYKSLMRSITSLFITIDPIGILRNYIRDLEYDLGSMDKGIQNLRGQMRKLAEVIKANEHDRAENLKMAKRAHESDKEAQFVLSARKAGRLQKSNLTLQGLYNKMELVYRALHKMYEVSSVVLEDMRDEVEVKKTEYEMIKTSYSAFSTAMGILRGQGDKKDLFDQAMEHLTDNFGQKMGEIEHFLEVSRTFIESVDLNNGIYEEDAIRTLEQWEKQGVSLLIDPEEKKLLIEQASNPESFIDLEKSLTSEKEASAILKKQKTPAEIDFATFSNDTK